jgi:rubrerythrin
MSDQIEIDSGETVYDENGEALGTVTGATTDGFTVSVKEDVEYHSVEVESTTGTSGSTADEESEEIDAEEHDPGHGFGEGYIMWRCEECGEMGELDDGLPEECPSCGSEDVIKWKED